VDKILDNQCEDQQSAVQVPQPREDFKMEKHDRAIREAQKKSEKR
jgi:hypothetical protein